MDANLYEEPDPIRALRPEAEDQTILWFRDDLHNPYPVSPLGMSVVHRGHMWGYAVSAEEAQLPPSRGPVIKSYGGRVYLGFANIADPETIGQRAQKFGGYVQNAIDNWDDFYGTLIAEAKETTLAHVKAPLKDMSLLELAEHLRVCNKTIARCWYIHFKTMYVASSVYIMGEQFAKEHGWSEDEYAQMLKGFDTFGLATDRGQHQLAAAALASQEVSILLLSDLSTLSVIAKLPETAAGQAWWKQLWDYLDVYGLRLTAAILDLNFPTWHEDPTSVVENIRQLLPKLKAGNSFEAERQESVRLREEAIAAFRSALSPEELPFFETALPKWQNSYKFSEDHWYYLEQVAFTGMRWAALEAADRLVSFGILDEREDIFQLTLSEILEALEGLAEDPVAATYVYQNLIRPLMVQRKLLYAVAELEKGPDFVGFVPDSFGDPIATKIFGLTDKVLERARKHLAGEVEERVDVLEGFPGSPGLVEGRATVVLGFEGFAKLSNGAIMVCPFTSPAWTSVFPKLAGIVTDSGGMLTHAAIAAREYGVPAVVGTWVATTQIHDGDLIRIDGNNGRVEILERAVR
jgi:pyruvate, water dikinase